MCFKNRIVKRKLSIFYRLQIKPHPLVTRITIVLSRANLHFNDSLSIFERRPQRSSIPCSACNNVNRATTSKFHGPHYRRPRYSQIRTLISIVTSPVVGDISVATDKKQGGESRKKEKLEDAVINPIASQEAGKNVGDLRFLGGRN